MIKPTLHLCHVAKPFVAKSTGRKFPVQDIFGSNFRRGMSVFLSFAATYGLKMQKFHKSVNPLVIYRKLILSIDFEGHLSVPQNTIAFLIGLFDSWNQSIIYPLIGIFTSV